MYELLKNSQCFDSITYMAIQGVTNRTDFWNNFCSNQYLKICFMYNL